MVLTSEASSLSQRGIFVLMMHLLGLSSVDKQLMYEWWLFTHHLLLLSVRDVFGSGKCSFLVFYFFLLTCIGQLYSNTRKPHQKFCLWFTCTEFPAAVDEQGRVWWVSSDHDLQHTLGQFAIVCEAAGMKVHTWHALPESGWGKKIKKCLLWFESELLPQVNELCGASASPRGATDLKDYGHLFCVPQASKHLSYWFRPLLRWTDSLKWSIYFGSGAVIVFLSVSCLNVMSRCEKH